MNTVEQVVILSAELSSLSSEQNTRRTALLNDMISELRLPFKTAKGIYKGSEESSFVVVVRNEADIETLANFAFKSFGQESVLHQDSNQLARLIFATGETQEVGKLVQVSKMLAQSMDNYTLMDGKYYTTISDPSSNASLR
jgi:hypothetical protein